jgi:hypothetical protein
MRGHISRTPARIVHLSASQSPTSTTTYYDEVKPIDKPQSLCLDDLPVEIVEEIAQHVRWRRKGPVPYCRCEDPRYHALTYARGPTEDHRDPTWAFASTSKRYREIVRQTKKSKSFDICYSVCCIRTAFNRPEEVRASVTYVPWNLAILLPTDIDYLVRSSVSLASDSDRYAVPQGDEHECCGECTWCDNCELCQESARNYQPPYELRDILALFPNTTDIDLHWIATSRPDMYEFAPTHSGNQLQHLRRLNIFVGHDDFSADYELHQAAEAGMIIDHFHMPVLEAITVNFDVSEYGRGYPSDFKAIGEALCRIESPGLRHIIVRAKVLIGKRTFPKLWVSLRPSLSLVSGLHALNCMRYRTGCHSGSHLISRRTHCHQVPHSRHRLRFPRHLLRRRRALFRE